MPEDRIFNNEYAVLIDVSQGRMPKIINPEIVEAITIVKEGKVDVFPGYDGVYGQLLIFPEQKETIPEREKIKQRSLADFM